MMRQRGFTLIELMVALALIALIATLAQPLAEVAIQRGKEAELRAALQQIRNALDAYKQAADEGRILIRPGDSGYPRNLELLVNGIEDARSPTRQPLRFLRQVPRDPFGDPDVKAAQTWNLRSYLSSPDNPQPGDDVYDVHSKSPQIGLNGIPYRAW